jgi:histidyl-tRNA synthetase
MSDDAQFQTLRGMRDILPEDAAVYRRVENAFWEMATRHGFQEIRTPVLEPTDLFARTAGEGSDIVGKEMYTFLDRSDHSVSLRPEGTAAIARAYLQHGLTSRPQPVKLAYQATMYRYERPQAGRFREHEQLGLEVFGSSDAAGDAHIIQAVWQLFETLGLTGITVQVNSVGGDESRRAMRQAIVDTLAPVRERLSEDVRRQLSENPLRILDSKDPDMRPHLERIPPLVDQLISSDREHLMAVLEYLENAGIAYELNPHLVRGLDYYTGTVFEFWGSAGGQSTLAAGGRYDHLVEELGGPATQAVGVSCGVDRIVEVLKGSPQAGQKAGPTQILIVQLGDEAKQIAFDLIGQLTGAGISAMTAGGKEGIRAQLGQADKLGVPMALIIGQKEALEKSLIIRDMVSGMQETVPVSRALEEIQARLPGEVKTGKSSR